MSRPRRAASAPATPAVLVTPAAPATELPTDTPWTKATRSGTSGECVELRRHGATIEVRDSKDPSGPVLRLAPGTASAWLDAVRSGRWDPHLG